MRLVISLSHLYPSCSIYIHMFMYVHMCLSRHFYLSIYLSLCFSIYGSISPPIPPIPPCLLKARFTGVSANYPLNIFTSKLCLHSTTFCALNEIWAELFTSNKLLLLLSAKKRGFILNVCVLFRHVFDPWSVWCYGAKWTDVVKLNEFGWWMMVNSSKDLIEWNIWAIVGNDTF